LTLVALPAGVVLAVAPAALAAKHANAKASSPTTSGPTATAAATSPATATTATSNPLTGGVNPVAPVPTTTSTTPTVVSTNSTGTAGSSSLSTGSALAIVVGAVVLIGGISYFIWHDARRRAPVRARSGDALAGDSRRAGSKPPAKPRKLSPAERRRRKRGRAKR
jgi:hypothetical protein